MKNNTRDFNNSSYGKVVKFMGSFIKTALAAAAGCLGIKIIETRTTWLDGILKK